MSKKNRSLSLSQFRITPHPQPPSRRKRPSRKPALWVMVLLVLCAIAITARVVVLLRRDDALMAWQRSLQPEGERIEWPPWNPAWPSLPASPKPTRAVPIDVAGPAAFAVRNADAMRYIPCYCGACPPDHRSNLNCYVTGFRPDGTPMWTSHASTCPICVHVTRAVMLMVRQGRSLAQIREALDREYERAGLDPSTSTPQPPQLLRKR